MSWQARPGDQLNIASTCLILGGPFLFLAGQTLFKRAVWGYVHRNRLMATGVLLALIPVAVASTVLLLLALATMVVIAAAWLSSRGHEPGLESR